MNLYFNRAVHCRSKAAVMAPLGKRAGKALIPMSILTIASGIILGIVTGVLDRLSTLNGLIWIASIVISCALFYFAVGILNPVESRLKKLTPGTHEFTKSLLKIKILIMIELFSIFILFVFMVLMRFSV